MGAFYFDILKGSDRMERSYFFDSVQGDQRIYNAADFARFHAQIIGNGVSNTASLPDLSVSAKQDMTVTLGAGYMFVNGYMYENTSNLDLTHDIADPTNDRIDRIVIRFDSEPAVRRNYATIKKGNPASNPVPPALTRNDYIFEMSVAQVRIIAGKSFIEQSQITDERENDDVCGYIPLHNIYRGLEINELGMVTMPNQSYVEMRDTLSLTLAGATGSNYVQTNIPIRPTIDRQNEVRNGVFYAKASGTYQFYFHISLDETLGDREKMEAYLVINDNSSVSNRVYLFNTPGNGWSDLHFLGSGIKHLDEGDKVNIVIGTRDFGGSRVSNYRRMSIAKLN